MKQEAEEGGLSCACDVVYVSRGGVLLLTVLPDTGNYDNPKIGPWRHRYINTRKEVVTLQKTNPFDTMAFFASVTEKLMMAENVLNPSVTRAVVFSADLVDFTTDYPECLTVGTLYDYVEAFNKRRHLNKEEYVKVCQALTACSDYLEDCLAASEKKKQAMKDQELLEATAARLANEKNEQFREEFAKTVVSGEDLAQLKERKNAAPKKDALAKDTPATTEDAAKAPAKDTPATTEDAAKAEDI